MATFGQRLRDLRKGKGLSQRALGDMVGINFTYLSKIENEWNVSTSLRQLLVGISVARQL